jgi:ParB/RepB/Spo0J family partition protein
MNVYSKLLFTWRRSNPMAETATIERPGETAEDNTAPIDREPDTTSPDEQSAAADDGTPYLAWIDPRDLLSHPNNPRKALGDLTELKESIASVGVVQALTVLPDPNGFRILAGWRRANAAAQVLDDGNWPAGKREAVPCLVDPSAVGAELDQLLSMVVENDQRVDLTPTERATAYAQLTLFGLDPSMIAKRVGRHVDTVKASLKLVKLGDAALKAADSGELELRDAARLSQFEADPDAMERLTRKIGNAYSLRHQLDEEERRAKVREREQQLYKELAAAGVNVIRRPKGWPYDCKAASVTSLRTADGERVDVDAVKTQSGFAGFVDKDSTSASAIIVCLDPEAHGYKRAGHSNFKTAEQMAEAQAKQRLHDEREQRITDAQELRHQFIVRTWGSAKAAKPLLVEAMRQTVAKPEALRHGDEKLIRDLAGSDISDASGAGMDRLNRILVAMWLAAEAKNLVDAINGRYGNDKRRALAFFDRLLANGYGLAEVETEAREKLVDWVQKDDAEKERLAAAAKAREEAAAAEAVDPAAAVAIAADEGVDDDEDFDEEDEDFDEEE